MFTCPTCGEAQTSAFINFNLDLCGERGKINIELLLLSAGEYRDKKYSQISFNGENTNEDASESKKKLVKYSTDKTENKYGQIGVDVVPMVVVIQTSFPQACESPHQQNNNTGMN